MKPVFNPAHNSTTFSSFCAPCVARTKAKPQTPLELSIERDDDLDDNMQLQNQMGSFPYLQQALLIACLSLLAIFVVKLYNARARFIELRKKGLVSHISQGLHII